MQVTVLYTVLKVKTLSQNSSIGIITSPHCLTEVRTSSAERKKWKQKEKICSLRIPLANECSVFETRFSIILETRLRFCIPETLGPIIIPISRTLHLLPRMLSNWFWSLLDSLYCNDGQSCYYRSNKTQQIWGSALNRHFWNLKHQIRFFNHQFLSPTKAKKIKRIARLSKPIPLWEHGTWQQ